MSDIIAEHEDHGVDHRQYDAPDLLETISRVQQDARADGRLAGRLPASDLDRLIEATVRSLWESSSVKTFVPLIALRHASEALAANGSEMDVNARPGTVEA